MTGTPAAAMSRRASIFEPIASIASGGGPIQVIPASRAGARERGVLGEEPVARVDRLGAGALGRVEDPLDVQVALRRRARADEVRLVRRPHVQRAAVGLRVHGDRADAELAQRPEDANRDLAAIRDEDVAEEGCRDHAGVFCPP